MPPKIRLKITPAEISLDLPDSSQTLHYANKVAYDPKRVAVQTYGKTEAELKKEMGAEWTAFRQRIVFTRMFDPQASGPIFDYQVLDLILLKARDLVFPKRFGKTLPLPWNTLVIDTEIQDYERLSLGRRLELEYYLQDFQHAYQLVINGKDRTIPLDLRRTQAAVGLLLRTLLPVIVLYGGLLVLTRQFQQGPLEALGWLVGGLAGALLTYLLGTGLWLLIFRYRLPHSYLRYQLRTSRSWLRRPAKWLADRLLE